MGALTELFPLLFFAAVGVVSPAQPGAHDVTSPRGGKLQRCFRDPPIGCFLLGYPYVNIWFLPRSPDDIDIHYEHVTRLDKRRFHWRDADDVTAARFRPEANTVVVVPGFTENATKAWVQSLARELARLPAAPNVFVLDWARGAGVRLYQQAVANGRVVAAMGALFLRRLLALGARPASLHLVGNSLGAHVAADMASRVPGAGRVTGLDPCRWAYAAFPPEARLDPSDARTVDVIHTDGGRGPVSSGTMTPLGSADFYANGGRDQPGCRDSLWDAILDFLGIRDKTKCSHARARVLFIESVRRCHLLAARCSTLEDIEGDRCRRCSGSQPCVTFGYHMDPNATGLYAFQTGSTRPFC